MQALVFEPAVDNLHKGSFSPGQTLAGFVSRGEKTKKGCRRGGFIFRTVELEALALIDSFVSIKVEVEVVVGILDAPNLVLVVDEVSAAVQTPYSLRRWGFGGYAP